MLVDRSVILVSGSRTADQLTFREQLKGLSHVRSVEHRSQPFSYHAKRADTHGLRRLRSWDGHEPPRDRTIEHRQAHPKTREECLIAHASSLQTLLDFVLSSVLVRLLLTQRPIAQERFAKPF